MVPHHQPHHKLNRILVRAVHASMLARHIHGMYVCLLSCLNHCAGCSLNFPHRSRDGDPADGLRGPEPALRGAVCSVPCRVLGASPYLPLQAAAKPCRLFRWGELHGDSSTPAPVHTGLMRTITCKFLVNPMVKQAPSPRAPACRFSTGRSIVKYLFTLPLTCPTTHRPCSTIGGWDTSSRTHGGWVNRRRLSTSAMHKHQLEVNKRQTTAFTCTTLQCTRSPEAGRCHLCSSVPCK
jgi:hypothetical protein